MVSLRYLYLRKRHRIRQCQQRQYVKKNACFNKKKKRIYSTCTNYLGNFVSILARYFQLSLPVWYRADMGGVRRPCKKVTLKYDLVR